MPISFTCPYCGHRTDVADEYAGQSGPCAQCGKTITVPLPGQVAYGSESPAALPRGRRSPGWVAAALGLLAIGLCLCCGGGFFLAMFLPGIQSAREAARRAQCGNHLRQIGMAMQSYQADYGCFPPAYVADDTQTYGKGLADVFATQFTALGGQVLKRDGIPGTTTDFT
ncbi:MAG TPA: DUF1559 domain-containing protein, partial [Pirellulales bacterium]|nr:DUF1559 domain-containing protein [Pirellulales bacterium]